MARILSANTGYHVRGQCAQVRGRNSAGRGDSCGIFVTALPSAGQGVARKGPGAPIKGAPTDVRHPGKSGGGDRVRDSNNLCSLNISFSFVPLRISSTSVQPCVCSAKGISHGG